MALIHNRHESLSTVDAAWLHMETSTNLMMITGLLTFDQALDYERLKATLDHRFVRRFPRFRQRVSEGRTRLLGLPFWVDDPAFDINVHIHRIALPQPGDQTALQELVSDLMSTPLDFSKPLWQFHLIENYGQGSALLVRLHHCIADGIALVRVMLSLADTDPNAPWPSSDEGRKPVGWNPLRPILRPAKQVLDSTQRMANTTLRTSASVIRNPEQLVGLARMGSETALATSRLLLMAPDPKTLFKGKLGVSKRAAWSQPIPLNDVKSIGRAIGGTINDVLLAAVSGALRRYMLSHETPVDFRAVIPVNLRSPKADIQLGNRFGLVFLALPVSIDDPVERLRELKRRMDQLKDSPEPLVAYGILTAIGASPPQIEDVVVQIFGSKATAVMTNLPGPREQLYFAGSPIQEMMFWVPQSGRLGLGVSILSYNDEVLLGVATDAGLVPDPEAIIDAFHQELIDMRAMVKQVIQETALALDVPLREPADQPIPAGPESRPATSADGSGLLPIKGIGPHYAALLAGAGIASFQNLAASNPAQLEAICASDLPRYQDWIDQAQALLAVE